MDARDLLALHFRDQEQRERDTERLRAIRETLRYRAASNAEAVSVPRHGPVRRAVGRVLRPRSAEG